MRKKTINVVLGFALMATMLCVGSSLDKQVRLHECVQETDGSDAQCQECYIKIYGEYPTN
jgi:hypothetical protein